jgi:hypothetical protein
VLWIVKSLGVASSDSLASQPGGHLKRIAFGVARFDYKPSSVWCY